MSYLYPQWRQALSDLEAALQAATLSSEGPPAPDNWGIYSLLSNLRDWGERWEAQGSPLDNIPPDLAVPNAVTAPRVLQAVLDQVSIALAAGPPFTGPPPAGLRGSWPFGKQWSA